MVRLLHQPRGMTNLRARTDLAAAPAQAGRSAARGPFRYASFAVVALVVALSGSRATFAEAIVVLNDGTRIRSDWMQADSSNGEIILRTERPGVELSRRLKLKNVQTATVNGTVVWPTNPMRTVSAETDTAEIAPDVVPQYSSQEFVVPPQPDYGFHFGTHPFPSGSRNCMTPGVPGTVIGIRDDPLSAYEGTVLNAFPNGVPLLEVEYALELMRARRAQDVLVPFNAPLPAPPATDVPPVPEPPPSADIRSSRIPMRNRVRSITVSARPINSNGKIDFDSLEVQVHALDLEGREVPVNGTVQFALWGQRQELIRTFGRVLNAEPGDIVKLGEWSRTLDPRTRAITAADGNVAASSRFVLPLSRPVPDHDLDIAALGDLHVKLAVPGEGLFEATAEGVPLRHRSPARDQHLVETGSSFLPGEGTTDNVRPAGSWRFTRPTSGPDRRVLSVEP